MSPAPGKAAPTESRGRAVRRHATSLVLIALALGVGAYAYFVDRGTISDTERERRKNDVFPAYRREDVSRVEVTRGQGSRLVLDRPPLADGGDPSWFIVAGDRRDVADQAAVERLLGAFEFASVVRKVDPKDAVGLDPPRASGVLGMGRLVYRFALGAPAPVPEGSAYFRVDGLGTFVITQELVTALLDEPDKYRERTLVPYLSLELSRLVVKPKAGSPVVLDRMEGTPIAFRLEDLGLRASRERVDRVWSALGEMRAESFLDDASADRAVADPAFTIEMTPSDKAKPAGELLVGGECPGHPEGVVVVRKLPTRRAACAPKGILEGLGTPRDALIDTRLFFAHADEMEELRIEDPGSVAGHPPAPGADARRIDIARKGPGWHERSPQEKDLAGDEADAANGLAAALARAEGDDVRHGDADAGTSFTARSRVTVARVEGGGDESVVVGPIDHGFASVKREADGAVLRVPAEVARRLLPSAIAIRSRALFQQDIDPLRISSRCEGVAQELARQDGVWSMHDLASGATLPPDVPGALDFASTVGRAKADAWVADADDGSFGFDKGDCSLTVEYVAAGEHGDAAPAPTTPHHVATIDFGREGEEGYYARLSGESAVFVAPKSLRALATRWLVDRSGFRVDPTSIQSVTVRRGSKSVLLSPHGQTLALGDGGTSDEAARAGEALAAMRTEGVVHIGPARADEGFSPPSLEVRVRKAGDGGPDLHFVVGHTAVWDNQKIYYARLDGVDATFAIAAARLAPMFDAL